MLVVARAPSPLFSCAVSRPALERVFDECLAAYPRLEASLTRKSFFDSQPGFLAIAIWPFRSAATTLSERRFIFMIATITSMLLASFAVVEASRLLAHVAAVVVFVCVKVLLWSRGSRPNLRSWKSECGLGVVSGGTGKRFALLAVIMHI